MMEAVADDGIERVYRAEHDRLWRSLLSYTGSADLASEAESEAFTQLIGRGAEIRDPAAWVWRSAYRIANGLMDRGRRPAVGVDPVPVTDWSIVDLLSMLDGLSRQQRACVVLRYVGGFTGAEIAELLDTSAGTVRVQLHRAHETLRATLETT